MTAVPPSVGPSPGSTAVTIGPGRAVIVKLGLEIAKKMFGGHATLTRAVAPAVGVFGTVIDWVPSFGVEARRVVGNVTPPSSENVSATFAQEIGAAVVPATLQVTVCSSCRPS
ncbi:MAG: hypothetical protein IPF66_25585 [Holophagales bacterium]|nr:hypothetical protein [Holophagales bacterium]